MTRFHLRYLALVATALLSSTALPSAHAEVPSAASDLGTAALPAGPGSALGLMDAGSVSFAAGSFDYPVSLGLAPFADLAPELELGYSSAFGDGPVGQGFGLVVPSVRRSTKNGVPSMTASDRLELLGLGGGTLVPDPNIGDGYWLEGRGRSLRVRQISGYFEITDDHGTQYLFGRTAAAQVLSGSNVVEWRLESITNLAGATVSYSYTADQGQLYLSAVQWGPQVDGASSFRVDLAYEARPDPRTSYRLGTKAVLAQRLKTITVTSFSTVVQTLTFNYSTSGVTSRVSSIQRSGRNNEQGVPTVGFGYTSGSSGGMSAGPNFAGWTVGYDPNAMMLDVDRDGYLDLFRVTEGSPPSCEYRRNLSAGVSFAEAQPMSSCPLSNLTTGKFVDLNGDGFTDYAAPAGINADWEYFQLSDGTFWDMGTWPGTAGIPSDAHFADVNGDGRVDVIYGGKFGGNPAQIPLRVRLNSATGFGPVISLNLTGANGLSGWDGSKLCDLNRDGLIDRYDVGTSSINLYYGRGDGTFEAQTPLAYTLHSANNPLMLTDFDGDGVSDLVEVGASTFYFLRGHSDLTFDEATTFTNPSGSTASTLALDIDGNGSPDLIAFSTDGRLFYSDMAGTAGTGTSLVNQIDNGLGGRTTIDYRALGVLAQEDELAGQGWYSKLPFSFPVVSRMTVTGGAPDAARTTDYHPQYPDWDVANREFLGFAQVMTTEYGDTTERNLTTTHGFITGIEPYYRELRGRESYTSRQDGYGNTLDATYYNWDVTAVPGLPSDFRSLVPILWETDFATYGSGGPIYSYTSFEYDSEARPIREIENGRTDMSGDERITELDYVTPDETSWVRNLVCAKRYKRGDWLSVGDSRIYYGDESQVAALCSPGKGWVRRVDGYWDFGDTYVTVASTTYDSAKNPLQVSDGNVTTSFAYDGYKLHPITRTLQPSSSSSLVWSYVWDNALGVLQQVTEPDGVVTHREVDGFGRTTSLWNDDLPPHVRFTYQLTGDIVSGQRPKYVEYVFDGTETELVQAEQAWPTGSKWRSTTHAFSGLLEPRSDAVAIGPNNFAVSGFKTRDRRGMQSSVAGSFYSTTDTPASTPAEVPVFSSSYDAFNRVISQQSPTGAEVLTYYDGFTRTVSRSDQTDTIISSDGLGRPISSFRSMNYQWEGTEIGYDVYDHVTSISRQGGQVVSTYAYDSLGRVTEASDPDSGRQGWYYVNASQLEKHLNGAGDMSWFHYDGAGRLARSGTGVVQDDQKDYTYHYDVPLTGTAAERRTAGRLAWVQEPEAGQVEVGYDRFGHRNWVSRVVRGVGAVQNFGYAASGLKIHEDAEDGFSLDYSYDGGGRLTQAGDYWRSTELDAAGVSLNDVYGNGLTETHVVDALEMATRVTLRAGFGAPVLDVGIERTLAGFPQVVTDYDGVGMDHEAYYYYDFGGRITDADFAGGDYYEYGYDQLSNFTYRYSAMGVGSMASGSYNYGGAGFGPHQLASVTPWTINAMPTSFAYDRAGRMTKQFDATLAYNARDQLSDVTTPAGQLGPGGKPDVNAHFSYGYDGLRTATADPATVIERWFDSNYRIINGTHEHFVNAGDRLVAQVTPGDSSATRYFHQAVMTGPELVTDSNGQVIEERRYEPYGQLARVESANASADMTNLPMNGLNQPSDPVTSFSFHGARWFDAQTAQWLSPDPASAVPSVQRALEPWLNHPYAYANNNPTLMWDADGAQPGLGGGYKTRAEARKAATTDIYVAMLNSPALFSNGARHEYNTNIYYYGGEYFYTTPRLGEEHSVTIATPANTFVPDGAVWVENDHVHPNYDYSSRCKGCDQDIAGSHWKDNVDFVLVGPNGDVYVITGDGKDIKIDKVSVDELSPELQDKVGAVKEGQSDRAMQDISNQWAYDETQAAALYKLALLVHDPKAFAASAEQGVSKDISSGCKSLCWQHVLPF